MRKILQYTKFPQASKIFRSFCSYTASLQNSTSKSLPIDVTDFEDLVHPFNNYAFVDKSLLIKDILHKKDNYLILRPEGWGKSLNLSMLKCFFSINNKDNETLREAFEKLKISHEEDSLYMSNFAFKFPVIHLNLNFSSQNDPTLTDVLDSFVTAICDSYKQHSYLVESEHLNPEEKHYVKCLGARNTIQIPGEDKDSIIREALMKLSDFLNRHHRNQCIILIDDYDAPAHLAIVGGFYPEILNVMQMFFDKTLSENPNLYKAVVMGAIPITKSYLFSSLKTVRSATFINEQFENCYGFNENEIKLLLRDFPQPASVDLFQNIYLHYRGYYSHATQRRRIYNPSSIIQYMQTKDAGAYMAVNRNKRELDLIYHLYLKTLPHDFHDIINITDGNFQTVEKNVHWHIIDKWKAHPQRLGRFYNPTKIWSVLFFTGFLTLDGTPQKLATHYNCKLQIPNKDMRNMFQYLKRRLDREKNFLFEKMKKAIQEKDLTEFFESAVLALRRRVMWIEFPRWNFDRERHYHEYLETLFDRLCSDEYEIISEEKSGEGRADILLIPKISSKMKHAYIFELKFSDEYSKIDRMLSRALHQIREKDYVDRILKHNHVEEIIGVGVVGTEYRDMHFSRSLIYTARK